jgi:hypothetical protein
MSPREEDRRFRAARPGARRRRLGPIPARYVRIRAAVPFALCFRTVQGNVALGNHPLGVAHRREWALLLHGVDQGSYQIEGSKERAQDTCADNGPLADLGATRMVVARRYSSDEMICHRHGDHTEYQRQESEEGDPKDWRPEEGKFVGQHELDRQRREKDPSEGETLHQPAEWYESTDPDVVEPCTDSDDDGEFEDSESAQPREAPDDLTRGRRALRFLARGHPNESHRHACAEPSGKTAGEAARDTACEKTPDPRKTVDP